MQYAHARIASILRNANSKLAFRLETRSKRAIRNSKPNYELLTTNYELDLIKQITRLPELVEDITANFQVHRLTSYATDLADAFHGFYENCPVLSEKEDLKTARLALCRATQIALANTLTLLGIFAPEKM